MEHYTPATYMTFKAELDSEERTEMIDKVFNTFINRNGDLCVLIFLSKIAETGLSLFSVNYFYVLDYVPGLSQYK